MSSSPQESNEELKGSRLFAALREKAQADLDAEAHQVPRAHPLEAVVIGVLVSASLLMCAYNVIVRYFVPHLVFDFVDEVQVYLIIWAVFLSLGSLTLMDRHVKSDFFVNMFPVAIQEVITRSVEVIGFCFSLMLVYYGGQVAYQAYDFGDVSTTMLRTPLWIYFAALPAGALVMAFAFALRLLRRPDQPASH